ncbi:methyl-accepting chemotaxis protein [Gilvimarinus xylanilyticus]|uniref:PAS domain-containing methyl-accepting chemotaxis protein n=1 Tax=Gilvimarinus xylanilyticus TaxID=2944139 RepID=A0A9X2KVC3_9GAMM|nr:PAS domain-containing methyl-accepting chemotaxis protein [Gilvimarinus xylanilyticus]MCP8897915.1 PAS domain-containing methyl-accepting chemotaxis protein [Gilvimarinus xylanilyticus]
MFFQNKGLADRVRELEDELKVFSDIQSDLQQEMISFWLDSDCVIKGANQNFFRCTGYGDSDIRGKPLKEILVSSSLAKDHGRRMLECIEQGKHWHGAVQIVKKNGEEAWFRSIFQPRTMQAGKPPELVSYSTELTQTISQSREHQDMLQALHRSSAVIEFTLDGTILDANENFLSCVGYSKSDVVGKHHRMFCTPETAQSSEYAAFWGRLARGEFVSDRFERVGRSGNVIWLEASYNPIRDDTGKYYKVVKFATDITEQMKREAAITETSNIAYEVSQKTDADTDKGIRVINSTIETMQGLSSLMQDASNGINELDTQSERVSSLVDSIKAIADQTNLLALNAAIEAARAGDQGRGFSVVADEVRQLALRTSEATEQIVEVVAENKQLTKKSVSLIEASLADARRALESSSESGSVMNEIQASARQVVDAVSEFKRTL